MTLHYVIIGYYAISCSLDFFISFLLY